jgi:hypothetical protein
MDVLELLDGNLHDFDAQLWRGLTPSAYESCRDGFRLRYWRRPIWIAKTIIPHDRQKAERRWQEILHDVVDRDVLWLDPVLPGDRKEQIGEPRQTMFSTALLNENFFIYGCPDPSPGTRTWDFGRTGLPSLAGPHAECLCPVEGRVPVATVEKEKVDRNGHHPGRQAKGGGELAWNPRSCYQWRRRVAGHGVVGRGKEGRVIQSGV